MQEFKLKVCLAGDSGVGKSEFACVNDKSTPVPDESSRDRATYSSSTIGIDLRTAVREHTNVCRSDGKFIDCKVKYEIWDTAGQERFRALVRSYFRSADVVILFYSVLSAETFANLKTYWYPLAREEAPPWCRYFIVGTLADQLEDNGGSEQRAVLLAEANEFASEINAMAFEVDSVRRGGLRAYNAFTTISHMSCETAQCEHSGQIIVRESSTKTQKKKKKC